ncbi:hypothetical protein HRbin04_00282 [archaeon HR04]|nr:hypothetical protein HRbin04_00282 [archaeon HR04]
MGVNYAITAIATIAVILASILVLSSITSIVMALYSSVELMPMLACIAVLT